MVSHLKSGTLFICATPIGNLGDVSLRLLETLKLVDIILALEDTRTIRKLSQDTIFKSSSNIISYQDYSSEKKLNIFIINSLKERTLRWYLNQAFRQFRIQVIRL